MQKIAFPISLFYIFNFIKLESKEIKRAQNEDSYWLYHPRIDGFSIQYVQEEDQVVAWRKKQKDLNPYKFAYHLWTKMSKQLKLYNSHDFLNENVTEISACPFFLQFKYNFKDLKKDFYFYISFIAFCNQIEDESNYSPLGFSEEKDKLLKQNYQININLINGCWEQSKDLLDGIAKEFTVSYVLFQLSKGFISEKNQKYRLFLDLYNKFLNIVPYQTSINIFASRELSMGLVNKNKQQYSSEILSQIQLSFPSENGFLQRNEVIVNQSKISNYMHPVKYLNSSMAHKVNWSNFNIFRAFFSNVINVSMVEPKKCAVFTFPSYQAIENFLISCMSYVYVNLIVQIFSICIPANCIKEHNDTNLTFKIKLDPDLLQANLDNFKNIVDAQCLYEPITISLQHYFFEEGTQDEISILYISKTYNLDPQKSNQLSHFFYKIEIDSKNDTKIFENELMFYLSEVSSSQQTRYIVNLLVFAQIFKTLRKNVKQNFEALYKELNSQKQDFFFDYSSLSFEKDVSTSTLMIGRLQFQQIHNYMNRDRFTSNQTTIGRINNDKFFINSKVIDLAEDYDLMKIKEVVASNIIQFAEKSSMD